MNNINKWQAIAVSLILVNILTIVAVILTLGNVIWFNFEQRELVNSLMQDRAEYIDNYTPFEGKE